MVAISAVRLAKPHTMAARCLGSLGRLVMAQIKCAVWVPFGFLLYESSVCLEMKYRCMCDVMTSSDGKLRKAWVLSPTMFHHSHPAHASPGFSKAFLGQHGAA